eukprot:Rmarinus@m.14723
MENELRLECKDCSMVFKTKEQLGNHKSKFCVGSEYADPMQAMDRLRRQETMSSAKNGSNEHVLLVDDVKQYLTGSAGFLGYVGDMSLASVRDQLKQRRADTDEARKEALARQAADYAAKAYALENERKKAATDEQDTELQKLLEEIAKSEREELNAFVEREQVKKSN